MKAKQYRFSRTALAVAMLSVFGAAQADDEAVRELTQPSSFASVGGGFLSGDAKDRSLFGQYNGLRKDDAYFLLDFLYNKRDEATGTWTTIEGRNLGLDTRELRGSYGPQGNWRVFGEYNEIIRWDPRTVNTSLQGAGSTTPLVTRLATPGTGGDLELKTERKRLGVGFEKYFSPNLMAELTFQSEDKDGARMYGRGFTCPSGAAPTPVCTALASGANQWAILFIPEPISSQTRQIEAKLNYSDQRLSLTAAYYGSFYDNDYGSVTPTVSGNLNNPLGNPMGVGGGVALTTGLRNILQQPMALWPDNEAHQFSLAGNYRFTPSTIATFKYAYTQAKQTENFESMGLGGAQPAGRSDLGGKLNTTLAQAGLTARPMPKLQLLANVKYEDKEDKTPIDDYNVEGTSAFTNGHISNTKLAGKLEASYQLPANFRGTVGLDYESIDRDEFVPTTEVAGLSGLRRKMYDRGYRLELRRAMADNLTGFVSYVASERNGSTWLKPLGGPPGVMPADPDCQSATVNGVPNACIYNRTAIFPYMLEDRERDKVRFLADWAPADRVSLQFAIDYGKDKYTGPTEKGLRDTDVRLFSIDGSYQVDDNWRLKAYYSYGEQTLRVAHSTGYMADIEDRNHTAGIGVVGRVTPKVRIGADLLYIKDTNKYGQTLDPLASAANVAFFAQSGGLPDVEFRDTRIKVYGAYALQKNADIEFEVVHDRTKLDEWTWGYNGVAFAFSDNTTVSLNPNQNVTYVALRYTYRFR